MKFYNDKLKEFRKQNRYTATDFCKVMKISRSTLWEWETGKRIPSEAVIRRFSKILNVEVNEISNLKEELGIIDKDFTASRHAVRSLFDNTPKQRTDKFENIVNEIKRLQSELDQAAVIINALLTTMHTMFYIKDANLKYVIANSNFLLNVSFPESFVSKGHDDKKFFSAREAKLNTEQDRNVLYTKQPIITQEGYIPGTRKKRWGLISKIPIMDSNGNASGIVGTFLDITERKNEAEIQRLLEIALNNTTYVVWLLHPYPNYRLFYVSKSVEKLYGLKPEKFLDSKSYWLSHCVHPDDREKLEKDWIYGKTGGTSGRKTFRIVCPDKTVKYIESILVNTEIHDTVAYIEKDITQENNIEFKTKMKIKKVLEEENVSKEIIMKIIEL
ncbi:MAG: PAS domain-containing protein [Victivallales bacterium]|nr:PAS domain-containing protein [Victivallales bacterium]MCF7889498.1 PAS domain-containing protein [Victivallales bacterium]